MLVTPGAVDVSNNCLTLSKSGSRGFTGFKLSVGLPVCGEPGKCSFR